MKTNKRFSSFRKAQGAMEFLMTYGWAILVVLLILSTLFYLGVFSPKTTSSCKIEAPFVCNDFVATEDIVTYSVGANKVETATFDIIIDGLTCSEQGGELSNGGDIANPNTITQVSCTGLDLQNKKVSTEIEITYTKKSGLEHTIKGQGIGSVEIITSVSCKGILEGGLSEGNGIYEINPDEGDPFEVYCDMNIDEGGWTLVFAADRGANFNSQWDGWWSDDQQYISQLTSPTGTGKSKSYDTVSFTQMMFKSTAPREDQLIADTVTEEGGFDNVRHILGEEDPGTDHDNYWYYAEYPGSVDNGEYFRQEYIRLWHMDNERNGVDRAVFSSTENNGDFNKGYKGQFGGEQVYGTNEIPNIMHLTIWVR